MEKESENVEGWLNVSQRSMLRMQEDLHYTEESFSPAALYPVGDQIHGVFVRGDSVRVMIMNYVVQYLVERRILHVTAVLAQFSGNFVALSMNKHGSHVVEKCMKYSGGDQVIEIIKEIVNSPKFMTVLQDPYGNFVVQSAMKFSKGSFLHKNYGRTHS